MRPSQPRSAGGHLPSARVIANWPTNLPPFSPTTDSTNPSAMQAWTCRKNDWEPHHDIRGHGGGGLREPGVAQPSWLWANPRKLSGLILAIGRPPKMETGQSLLRITLQLPRAA